jgi:hypothetical protein
MRRASARLGCACRGVRARSAPSASGVGRHAAPPVPPRRTDARAGASLPPLAALASMRAQTRGEAAALVGGTPSRRSPPRVRASATRK